MEIRLKPVRSRDNPQVKALVKLAGSSRERRQTGTTIVEGEHLVRAYRDTGQTAETLFVSESSYAKPEIRALVESAPANARLLLADALVAQISQLVSAAGIAAVVSTPRPAPLPRESATCLLLENLQDPGNLGSILRSAVAAGVSNVLLSRGSVFAWSPKVVRAGMGAHFAVSISEEVELGGYADTFEGRVVAMDPRADKSLYDLDLSGPVAWIFGNEGGGITEGLRKTATESAKIPMPGRAESLNVAAAAAICMFEQLRQQRRA
jgi:TrmH family RNA methyltransferase